MRLYRLLFLITNRHLNLIWTDKFLENKFELNFVKRNDQIKHNRTVNYYHKVLREKLKTENTYHGKHNTRTLTEQVIVILDKLHRKYFYTLIFSHYQHLTDFSYFSYIYFYLKLQNLKYCTFKIAL